MVACCANKWSHGKRRLRGPVASLQGFAVRGLLFTAFGRGGPSKERTVGFRPLGNALTATGADRHNTEAAPAGASDREAQLPAGIARLGVPFKASAHCACMAGLPFGHYNRAFELGRVSHVRVDPDGLTRVRYKGITRGMQSHHYRPDIEGLRAIAVLSVVGFHASPNWISGGFVGVDIFFVISGYLITSNICAGMERHTFSIGDFYSRRIRRIFPALCLVLLFSAVVGWFYLLALEYRNLGKHIAGAASFIENVLYFNEQGYFDESSLNKPLLQLWSLGVEEQFYLAWPLLLWLVNRSRLSLPAVVLTIIALSFICNVFGGVAGSASSFFLVQSRIWELALGALIALPWFRRAWTPSSKLPADATRPRMDVWRERAYQAAPYAGLGLIFASVLTFTKDFWFPGWWALMPTLGAVLVIAGNPAAAPGKRFLSNRIMVWFGKISFPLYLWHWVLLSFLYIIVPEAFSRNARFLAVLVSIVLSWLTYKYVETPFRANSSTRTKVTVLATAMAILFAFGLATYLGNGLPERSFARHFMSVESAITDWQYPKGLTVRTVEGQEFLATSDAPPSILFIGDSHTNQFQPRTQELFKKKLLPEHAFLTFNGCPPIPDVYEDKHPNCVDFIATINATLKALPSIRVVVIGGCWNCYFGLETKPVPDVNNFNYVYRSGPREAYFRKGEGAALAMNSLEKYLSELSKNYTVYLILDNQMADENDPRQVLRNRLTLHRSGATPDLLALSPAQKALNASMRSMAERAGVHVIDPLPSLCPDDVCPIFSAPGVPIFKDSHHLRSGYVADRATFIDQIQPR